MAIQYIETMARNTRRKTASSETETDAPEAKSRAAAPAAKAEARRRNARKADAKADEPRQSSVRAQAAGRKAEIEEMFRRFQAAEPEPKSELKYVNPFTLLVAVVLSAQATDAGVNKATPALFAWPTRRRRWWRSARTGCAS